MTRIRMFVLVLVVSLGACSAIEPASQAVFATSRQLPAHPGRPVIVFVHGLWGGPDTWRNTNTNATWPSLIESDPRLANFDTYTANYTSNCAKSPNPHEVAQQLISALLNDGVFNREQIYFVAHSLGGVVVRDLYLRLTEEQQKHIALMATLGTPTQGVDIAKLASWICPGSQAADLDPIAGNAYLQKVEDDFNDAMREARRNRRAFPRMICAYEIDQVAGITVVPRGNAAATCDENIMPIDENHFGLAKPSGLGAQSYIWLRNALLYPPSILSTEGRAIIVDLLSNSYRRAFSTQFVEVSSGSSVTPRTLIKETEDSKAVRKSIRECRLFFQMNVMRAAAYTPPQAGLLVYSMLKQLELMETTLSRAFATEDARFQWELFLNAEQQRTGFISSQNQLAKILGLQLPPIPDSAFNTPR